MIKYIISDVGGVLINFTEQKYLSYLSKKVNISEKRLEHVLLPLIITMEYGRMDLDHAEKIFADHFNIQRSKLEWVEGYKKIAKPNKKMLALLRKLSKHYKIGLITNISKSRYRECMRMTLGRLVKKHIVRDAVVSSYEGLRKPDRKIYRLALKRLGAKASETVFFDDRKENVDGAKLIGINAIRFRNYKQLVADLKKLGIK